MSKCRHDGYYFDYDEVACSDCPLRDGDLLADLFSQRDAAEAAAIHLAERLVNGNRDLMEKLLSKYGLKLREEETDEQVQA